MLLIVLMIILLTTTTASFALQGSAVEVQAAGGMKRNTVVRANAESLVMAGAALVDAVTDEGIETPPPDVRLAGMAALDATRARGVDVTNFEAATNRVGDEVLTEAMQRDDIGTVSGLPSSPSVPSYRIVKETWPRTDTSPGASATPKRIVWTIISSTTPPGDVTTPDEVGCRSWHQMVNVTQAYFDAN